MAPMTINGSFPDATTSGTGRRAACGRGLLRSRRSARRSRIARAAWDSGPRAFWNDVPLVEQTAIKPAANEIVRDDPPQRSNIAFGVGCEPVAFHLRYLIFWFGVRPHGLLLRRTISHTNPSEQSDTDDRSCVRHKFPPVPT